MKYETPHVIESMAGTLRRIYGKGIIIYDPGQTPKGLQPSWRISKQRLGGCLFLGLIGRNVDDLVVVDAADIIDNTSGAGRVSFYIDNIGIDFNLMPQLHEDLRIFAWSNPRKGQFLDISNAPKELYKPKENH